MVKKCSWGLCKSDSRYPERLAGGIIFIPFPKPSTQLEKCQRWIKACGRPHHQLNVKRLTHNYQVYVCSKHFVNGYPNELYPDPIPACGPSSRPVIRPCRRPRPPRPRSTIHLSKTKTAEPVTKTEFHVCQPEVDATENDATVTADSSITSDHIADFATQSIATPAEVLFQKEPLANTHYELDLLALAAENKQQQNELKTMREYVDDIHQELQELRGQQNGLKMLAVTAENKKLTNELQMKDDEIQGLKKQLDDFQKLCASHILQNMDLKQQGEFYEQSNRRWSVQFLESTGRFKYYTAFTKDQFLKILEFLTSNKEETPIQFTKKITAAQILPVEDQFLITLMKLRNNYDFKHLADLFIISEQTVGELFREWIHYLFFKFGEIPIWPHRDIILGKMPSNFKKDFPTTIAIFDGTEMKCERPSALKAQSQCYSDYKSSTTLKGLVAVDPKGSFIFISMLFSGAISDKEITIRSGLLHQLQLMLECGKLLPGDGIMVDKGFLIASEIEDLGLKLWMPPFASSGSQMSAADVTKTRKIAKYRVLVENALSRAKKFKIIDQRLDLNLWPSVNQIWHTCCFLTNFMPCIITDV